VGSIAVLVPVLRREVVRDVLVMKELAGVKFANAT
jgi:hypothetical protein